MVRVLLIYGLKSWEIPLCTTLYSSIKIMSIMQEGIIYTLFVGDIKWCTKQNHPTFNISNTKVQNSPTLYSNNSKTHLRRIVMKSQFVHFLLIIEVGLHILSQSPTSKSNNTHCLVLVILHCLKLSKPTWVVFHCLAWCSQDISFN